MVQWNGFLIVFLCAFFLSAWVKLCLVWLNIRYLRRHGHEVPEVFRGWIEPDTLARMTEYSVQRLRFGALAGVFQEAAVLIVLLSGALPWLVGRLFPQGFPFIVTGLLFFGILALADGILNIPFDLYDTFGIERRHGFSTITVRLWIVDQIKNFFLSLLLGGVLLGALLALMQYTPDTWWLWVWVVFASCQILLLWLYPIAIAPLFNKYTPVANETLKNAIVAMMAKAGLKTEGVYQVDEGIRSRHANAYFTGVGTTKRIVLFDMLLQSHTQEEVLAILAHEIGHWQKKHMLKQLFFMEIASLMIFYGAFLLVRWPLLYRTFGFSEIIPYGGLALVAAIAAPFSFFLAPLGAAVMRRFEREADDYSRVLSGGSRALGNALRRLARDNLANLHPHPLYAWFYYSHPPLAARIARLEAQPNEKAS